MPLPGPAKDSKYWPKTFERSPAGPFGVREPGYGSVCHQQPQQASDQEKLREAVAMKQTKIRFKGHAAHRFEDRFTWAAVEEVA